MILSFLLDMLSSYLLKWNISHWTVVKLSPITLSILISSWKYVCGYMRKYLKRLIRSVNLSTVRQVDHWKKNNFAMSCSEFQILQTASWLRFRVDGSCFCLWCSLPVKSLRLLFLKVTNKVFVMYKLWL